MTDITMFNYRGKKDLIGKALSNLKIVLAIAERVYTKLENQNIATTHEEVFDQQEALGITEALTNSFWPNTYSSSSCYKD